MGRFKIAFAPLRTMKEGATMNECAAPELGPILRYKQFLFDRIPSLEEAFPDSSGVGSSDDRERRKLREFESHKFEYTITKNLPALLKLARKNRVSNLS